MHSVVKAKNSCTTSGSPVTNMWCTKTTKPSTAIAAIEAAIAR